VRGDLATMQEGVRRQNGVSTTAEVIARPALMSGNHRDDGCVLWQPNLRLHSPKDATASAKFLTIASLDSSYAG
jgi:hypothetical protein